MPTFKKDRGFKMNGIDFGTTPKTKTTGKTRKLTGKTKKTPPSKTYEGPDSNYGFEKWDKE